MKGNIKFWFVTGVGVLWHLKAALAIAKPPYNQNVRSVVNITAATAGSL
jgi:hypothetical protein